jgi:hypothetical protein
MSYAGGFCPELSYAECHSSSLSAGQATIAAKTVRGAACAPLRFEGLHFEGRGVVRRREFPPSNGGCGGSSGGGGGASHEPGAKRRRRASPEVSAWDMGRLLPPPPVAPFLRQLHRPAAVTIPRQPRAVQHLGFSTAAATQRAVSPPIPLHRHSSLQQAPSASAMLVGHQ